MSDFTEFHELIKKTWELRCKKAELEAEKKKINAEISALEGDIEGKLEEIGVTSYNSPFGTVGTMTKYSVKLPASPEDKDRLFDWIEENKGKAALDGLLTIHSATLNKFYNEEVEAAAEKGEVLFSIPGLKPPSSRVSISFRGFKK